MRVWGISEFPPFKGFTTAKHGCSTLSVLTRLSASASCFPSDAAYAAIVGDTKVHVLW